MRSEKEINMIRGKISLNGTSGAEIEDFFKYVDKLEELVKEASDYDVYGTQGWKYAIGWED